MGSASSVVQKPVNPTFTNLEEEQLPWKKVINLVDARKKYVLEGSLRKGCSEDKLICRVLLDDFTGFSALETYISHSGSQSDNDLLQEWSDMISGSKSITEIDSCVLLPRFRNVFSRGGVKTQQKVQQAERTMKLSTCFDRIYSELYLGDYKNSSEYHTMCKMLRQTNRVYPDDFDYFTSLGTGSFGCVFSCRKRSTGVMYAMKVQPKRRLLLQFGEKPEDVLMELLASTGCPSPYVAQAAYAFQTTKLVFLAFPLYAGDLRQALKSMQDGYLPRNHAQFFAAELAAVLMFLHRNGLMHRDLKPENVFIDKHGHIVLGDLGSISDELGRLQPVLDPSLESPGLSGSPVGFDNNADWRSPVPVGIGNGTGIGAGGRNGCGRVVQMMTSQQLDYLDNNAAADGSSGGSDIVLNMYSDTERRSNNNHQNTTNNSRNKGKKVITSASMKNGLFEQMNSIGRFESSSSYSGGVYSFTSKGDTISERELQELQEMNWEEQGEVRAGEGVNNNGAVGAIERDNTLCSYAVESRAEGVVGTIHYMAPEILALFADKEVRDLLPHGCTPALDWFSYGVMVHEMLTGKCPFIPVRGMTYQKLHANYTEYLYEANMDICAVYTRIMGEFICTQQTSQLLGIHGMSFVRDLIQLDPTERSGLNRSSFTLSRGRTDVYSELKNEVFFQGIDWEAVLNHRAEPPGWHSQGESEILAQAWIDTNVGWTCGDMLDRGRRSHWRDNDDNYHHHHHQHHHHQQSQQHQQPVLHQHQYDNHDDGLLSPEQQELFKNWRYVSPEAVNKEVTRSSSCRYRQSVKPSSHATAVTGGNRYVSVFDL